MEIKLIYIQSGKEEWAEKASSVYLKKINHYFPFKIDFIKTQSLPRSKKNEKIKLEKDLILKKISDKDYLIIFDENGKILPDSRRFSKDLESVFNLGKKNIVFLIGGSYGFDDQVKERSNKMISLSNLTMNHHVAKVVALEQIYRAICIQKNIPYHND